MSQRIEKADMAKINALAWEFQSGKNTPSRTLLQMADFFPAMAKELERLIEVEQEYIGLKDDIRGLVGPARPR